MNVLKITPRFFLTLLLLLLSPLLRPYTFAITLTDPDDHTIQLKPRPLPDRHNKCHLCHLKKTKEFIRSKKSLFREHTEKSNIHGDIEMSCNNCHDVNHSNYLRSTSTQKVSFKSSSPVCQRCHANQFRDWLRGTHGKREGKWNGERIQYNCIDCHDPHSVVFKPMESKADPFYPKFLIQKPDHEDHER